MFLFLLGGLCAIISICCWRQIPGGKSKLVISIGMVLPYPVGTQLSIWLPSVPYMAAAATSTWNYTFSTDFLPRTKVSRDALYLEVAQLRRQRWVSLPQLDVSLFKMCPPLYYHICQFTIKFPLHLKSISTKCLTDQFYHIFGILRMWALTW